MLQRKARVVRQVLQGFFPPGINRAIGCHDLSKHQKGMFGRQVDEDNVGKSLSALIVSPMDFARSSSRETTLFPLSLTNRIAGSSIKRGAKTSMTAFVISELGPGFIRRLSPLGNVTLKLSPADPAPRRTMAMRARAPLFNVLLCQAPIAASNFPPTRFGSNSPAKYISLPSGGRVCGCPGRTDDPRLQRGDMRFVQVDGAADSDLIVGLAGAGRRTVEDAAS